jgi:hypothetical protein
MALHEVRSTISGAVRELLDECEPQYRAAHLLALRLAENYERTGRSQDAAALISLLDALLATPKAARAGAAKSTEAPSAGPSALAQLRAAHSG